MRIAQTLIVGFAVLASFVASPALAVVQCCYYEDNPPSSLQVSSGTVPHGYMTHHFGGPSSDTTFDSRAAAKWTATSAAYKINMAGSIPNPPYTQADLRAQIVSAAGNWYSTLSSTTAPLTQFTDGGPTTAKPSLFATMCGTGSDNANGVNEIGFCNFPGGDHGGMVKLKFAMSSGTIITQTEADMVFDSEFPWSPTGSNEMYNVALHEFGHFYFLGDLYLQKGLSCTGEQTPLPEMCDANTGSLQWGDKDGIRWLYPKTNSFSLSASGTISGSDSAVTSIDQTVPDVMFVWGDYSSGTGQTTIKAKVIWDISSSTGTGTTGTTVNIRTVTGQVLDIGAELYLVNTGTAYDLIVSYTVGTTGTNYLVYWDITRSSNSFTYTGPAGPYFVTGSSGDKGTDIIVYDLTSDGSRDLLVVDSDGSPLKIWYYYGTLSTSGTVSSWTTGSSSGVYSINTEDSVGVQRPHLGDTKIYTVAYRDDSGRMRQHLFHITSSGSIDQAITYKFAPHKSTGTATGIGAGDAIALGEKATYRDQFFSWTDSSTGYYTIEWDSRLNSHV